MQSTDVYLREMVSRHELQVAHYYLKEKPSSDFASQPKKSFSITQQLVCREAFARFSQSYNDLRTDRFSANKSCRG